MPVQSWGHGQYWVDLSTFVPPPPPPVVSRGGYPGWQAGVVTPSLFGAIGAWWDGWTEWLVQWWRFDRRVAALPKPRRDVLLHTLDLLESPAYTTARLAVRKTATTPAFNRHESWKPDWQRLKTHKPTQERFFRYVHACHVTVDRLPSTIRPDDLSLAVVLARQEYARVPWGST